MGFFRICFVSIFLFGVGIIPATVAAQSVTATEQAEIAGPVARTLDRSGWLDL